MTTPENRLGPWHAISRSSVLEAMGSTEEGLSPAEAARRLKKHGRNSLPQPPARTGWAILLRQFLNPLIYILIAAAAVSLMVGDFKDAIFIGIVLSINALIGGYQEWKAEQSSRAMQKLLQIRATIQRDCETIEVDAEEVVPGDIVWLESGNRVPADVRLISAHGLEVDESSLTGESIAVNKDSDWHGEANVPMADRLNLAFAASIVVRGRAKGIVVGTGAETEVGRLAIDVMSSTGGRPPLLERMDKFSRVVAYAVLVAVSVVSLTGVLLHGYSAQQMFLFGVALAVSAIPEGLPAALTVALAVAASRMARRGVIVRRLAAVEGLGSCTLIASDKTGTLTCNELTVRLINLSDGTELRVTGEGFSPVGSILDGDKVLNREDRDDLAAAIQVAVLCNEATLYQRNSQWAWRGDPTDVALLSLGQKIGVGREDLLAEFPQVGEIPFEPEYQYAASFHQSEDGVRAFVKGAPEKILAMCQVTLDEAQLQAARQMAEQLAARGFRVLGLAQGQVPKDSFSAAVPTLPLEMSFCGYLGMIDPLRAGARRAVEDCRTAGIKVCMVTGDHPVTALAISRELGLANDTSHVVTGGELAECSPGEFIEKVQRGRVFARMAPRQKLQLVEAARAAGEFVAVTGDGVNDAPALRAANIGVAMGKNGTDVAREAAELVISDDNFSTIVSGIEEGRVAYDNVRKVVFLLVAAGLAEVLLIAVAFAIGTWLPLPFLPVQLLWLNLVTNGIQGIALAFEPGEPGVLRRKPRRPSEPIFDRLMIERTLVVAMTMAVVGVAAFAWMIQSGWSEESARNGLLLLMVLFENVHVGNCRSEYRSGLRMSPFSSPFLLFGATAALLLHVVAMHTPLLQSVLRTEPISLMNWVVLALLSLTVFVAIEVHKWTWHWRFPEDMSLPSTG
jgi:P-type Ca2+ transporter type 2C